MADYKPYENIYADPTPPSPDHRLSACEKRISAVEADHIVTWQSINSIFEDVEELKQWRTEHEKDDIIGYNYHCRQHDWNGERITDLEGVVRRLPNAEQPPLVTAKAGPIGEADTYAHIPKVVWQDICAELEDLRAGRPDMDETGILLSHDAYDMLEREAAIGRSIPWEELWRMYSDEANDATWLTIGIWLMGSAQQMEDAE